jgi:hypothetical protein
MLLKLSARMAPHRIFLLSPASSGGERAALLFNPRTEFELARRLRTRGGAELGEVFSFLSGLYFRGKLTYAREFARPPAGAPGVLVITSGKGLQPPETRVTLRELERFARIRINVSESRYRKPLSRDAQALARAASGAEIVLVGSIATGKYVDVLLESFGRSLTFPSTFVGRGDMSRGGLLLRSARAGTELDYVPVQGAVRHGARPPRLEKLRR